MQPCPHCAEQIPERVDHCPFCRSSLLVEVPAAGPSTPAGWYSDPSMVNTWRYWDGSSWTQHRAPVDFARHPAINPVPQAANPPAPLRGSERRAGWYRAPDAEHAGQERYWDGSQWLPSWRPTSERAVGRATTYVKIMNRVFFAGVLCAVLGYLLSRIAS